jgi:succinate-acetate transporter protein
MVLGLMALMWHELFGMVAFIAALWLIFIQFYLIPNCKNDIDNQYTQNPHEIAKIRGWEFSKAQSELQKIYSLHIKERDDKKLHERIWEIRKVPKLKQSYISHLKHMEIIVAVMVPFFGIVALIAGFYGW